MLQKIQVIVYRIHYVCPRSTLKRELQQHIIKQNDNRVISIKITF